MAVVVELSFFLSRLLFKKICFCLELSKAAWLCWMLVGCLNKWAGGRQAYKAQAETAAGS
jgi:hypothetical protein